MSEPADGPIPSAPPPPAPGTPPALRQAQGPEGPRGAASPPSSPPDSRPPKHVRKLQRRLNQAMFKRLRRFYLRGLILFGILLLIPAAVFRNHVYWTLAITGQEQNPFRRAAWDHRVFGEKEILVRIRDNLADPAYAETAIRDGDVPFWLGRHAPEVKLAFVEGLGFLREDVQAREALRRLLADPAVTVRPEVAVALANHRDPADAPRLEALLEAGQTVPLRAAAARALGILGQHRSIPRLEAGTKDPSEVVARASLKALSMFEGSADAARILLSAFQGRSPGIRAEALSAASLLVAGGAQPKETFAAFSREGCARLQDADLDVRREAIAFLGALKDGSAIPAIVQIYASREPALEGTAAQAIAGMGPAALPALRGVFSSGSPALRREAAWLVGRIVHPGAIELLLDLLHDPDPYVRQRSNLLIERLTGHKGIYFDYAGPEAERARDEAAWRAWWKANASDVRLTPLDLTGMAPPPIPKKAPQ